MLIDGTPDELRAVQAHPLVTSTTALVAAGLRQRRDAGALREDADPDLLALGIETISFSLLLTTLRAGLVGDPRRVAGVLAVIHAAAGGPPTDHPQAADRLQRPRADRSPRHRPPSD